MGRAHHSVFLWYFEMGRTELLRERGLAYRDMEARGRHVIVAEVSCRYRAAARYDDDLIIETRVEQIRGPRIVFVNRALRMDGGRETVLAEATITAALVDPAGRLQRFTPEEIRLIKGE
jgi:acyl-CoA thioester hydrolase